MNVKLSSLNPCYWYDHTVVSTIALSSFPGQTHPIAIKQTRAGYNPFEPNNFNDELEDTLGMNHYAVLQ